MSDKEKAPTSNQDGVIGRIVVLSHKFNDVEIVEFDWVSGYGWTFSWYENEREKSLDCMTYGLFPQDFLQINGRHQHKIEEFLKDKPKDKCIDVSYVLAFLNAL